MRVYDLSCELKEGMWYYGKPYIPFEMEKIATMEKNGYIARSLSMSTHMGTHVECGNHWGDDKKTLDQIAIESFIGHAKVLRFPEGKQKLFEIDKQNIIAAGGENLKEGDICILNTGWDANIDDNSYVTDSPFISIDAAEYLVAKK
jgi:arylformamidase